MTAKNYKLHAQLMAVQKDAERVQQQYEKQLTEKPLYGWSQEKHERYCNERIIEAKTVAHYCFIRQMQIDPD